MKNRDSLPGRYISDEPTFVVRASDPLGPALVEEWCKRYRQRIAKTTGNFTPEQAKNHADALNQAIAMHDWRMVHARSTYEFE